MLWYLQEDRARIFFQHVKTSLPMRKQNLRKSKKDTNAQEGLGGFIKNWRNANNMAEVLSNISQWLKLYGTQHMNAKQRTFTKFEKRV